MKKFSYEHISLLGNYHPLLPLVFHTDTIKADKPIVLSNWHEEIEILTVFNGNGTLHCDNEDFPMTSGDVMIINSESLHSITSDSEVNYYCMIITRDFCSNAGVDTSKLRFKTLIRDTELHSQLTAAAGFIKRFNSEGSNHLAISAKARLLDALALLSKDYTIDPSQIKNTHSEADERIKKAIVYISDNVTKPLALEEIAAAVGISKFHLSREFKRMTDMTVFNFIILTRLKLARRLIRQGYSVSESALSSGFENLSYFSKKFREVQGITPSEYAANYKRASR